MHSVIFQTVEGEWATQKEQGPRASKTGEGGPWTPQPSILPRSFLMVPGGTTRLFCLEGLFG